MKTIRLSKATNIRAEVKQSVFEKQMQIWAAADESFHTAMAANFRLLEFKNSHLLTRGERVGSQSR